MKQSILLLTILFISTSCGKKDDKNKDYLIYQLDRFYSDRENVLRDEYLYHYSLIENQPKEKIRYDSLIKISDRISELLIHNIKGDRKRIIELRDSIVAAEGLPIGFQNQDSIYENIDDSIFSRRSRINFLEIREQFHYFKIYKYHSHSKREL